jgi:hypothetical protein
MAQRAPAGRSWALLEAFPPKANGYTVIRRGSGLICLGEQRARLQQSGPERHEGDRGYVLALGQL